MYPLTQIDKLRKSIKAKEGVTIKNIDIEHVIKALLECFTLYEIMDLLEYYDSCGFSGGRITNDNNEYHNYKYDRD
jgi:hypothetical protein